MWGNYPGPLPNQEGSPMFFSGFIFLGYSGQKWRGHCLLYWDRKHCIFTKTYIFFIRSTRLDHISQSTLQEGISNVDKILSSGIWGRSNECHLQAWPLNVSQVSSHGNFIQSTDIGTLEFIRLKIAEFLSSWLPKWLLGAKPGMCKLNHYMKKK